MITASKYFLPAMALAALVGCKVDFGVDGGKPEGGSGAVGGVPVGQGLAPDGIWQGNTPENTTKDITLFLRKGSLVMIGRGLVYFGNYDTTVSGGNFGASVSVYNANGLKLTNAPVQVNGNRVNETTLTLAVAAIIFNGTTIANPQTMNFELQTAAWERASALELIAYDWTIDIPSLSFHLDFPIGSTGALNPGAADSDGCGYSGALGLLDTTKNLYSVGLTLTGTGCDPLTGTNYGGYASLMPDDKSLLILASNGTNAFSLRLTRP